MRLITTPYGRAATARLAEVVAAAKGDDALAPVSVVVPHNYAGVSVRRSLGRSVVSGGRPGVAAVQFLTPYRLAELLGGPLLAQAGRRPVSTAVLAATVRGVLADEPGIFGPVREHPATERALVAAHRELSELGPGALERLAAQGRRAAEVVRVHRSVWGRLHQGWYVETDLAAAAVEALHTDPRAVAGFGPIVWHLPQRLPASSVQLAVVLAEHQPTTVVAGLTGVATADAVVVDTLHRLGLDPPVEPPTSPGSLVADASLQVVSTSDADEEVRAVVRGVVDASVAGVPLDAIAVLHAGREPYGRLLHEQLAAADIPVNGTTPQALAESVVGRTLLGLLALPDHDFRRVDVFALLASAPIRWKGWAAPTAAWERVSRTAGVVGGAEQWAERLDRHAGELRRQAADEAEGEHRDALIERLERTAHHADELAEFVVQLVADTTNVPGGSWRDRARWATRLVRRYLGDPGDDWPAIQLAAADKVQAALDRLAGLDAVDPAPTTAVFRRTLVHELDASLGRVGRLGSGVLVASPRDAVGVDLQRVFVVGLAEGIFPARVRDDSLLPDRERGAAGPDLVLRSARPHDDHRQLLAVLSSADEAAITWPRGDLRRSSERMPSRWLVELVEGALGPVPGPGLHGADTDFIDDIPSHVGGLLRSPFPASPHEYDLRALLDNEREGATPDRHQVVAGRHELARGVELVRARQSHAVTRFDGVIGPQSALDPTAADHPVSATRLETWVSCPFKYFMQYELRVLPIDEVDEQLTVSALDRGSLVHEVLDEFVTEVLARPADQQPGPGQPWSPDDHARVEAIAERHLRGLEARGLAGRAVFWRPERRTIVRELGRFLLADDAWRAESGARPFATEMGFGLAESADPALVWPLPDGRSLAFRGSADRVDRLPGGGLAVLDYKTGRADKYRVSGDDPDHQGSVLQLPIYAQAARRAAGDPDAPTHAAYWFVSDRGRYKQVGYEVTPEVIARFDTVLTTITDGIAAGMFVPHPDEPQSYVPYVTCPYCDPDGLGTRHRYLEWERKSHAPELAAYLDLVEPDSHEAAPTTEAAS